MPFPYPTTFQCVHACPNDLMRGVLASKTLAIRSSWRSDPPVRLELRPLGSFLDEIP